MRTLIYTASLGAPVYRRMTELCIHSLREVGCYNGSILVFTNNGYRPRGPGIEVISVPPVIGRTRMQEFKVAAAPQIASHEYDRILWIDCDILAVDRIAPLLGEDEEEVRGALEEPFTRMSDPACGDCLTPDELRRASGRWGINAGLLSFPGHKYQEYARLWREEMELRRSRLTHWTDQTPFNALVLNGRIPFRPYPRGLVEMPPMYYWNGGRFRVTAETCLLHLLWTRKSLVVEEMRVYLEALGAAPRRRARRPVLAPEMDGSSVARGSLRAGERTHPVSMHRGSGGSPRFPLGGASTGRRRANTHPVEGARGSVDT